MSVQTKIQNLPVSEMIRRFLCFLIRVHIL